MGDSSHLRRDVLQMTRNPSRMEGNPSVICFNGFTRTNRENETKLFTDGIENTGRY